MDYREIEVIDNGIRIKDIRNFDPKHIFECGQCFRWDREEDGSYTGVAFEKVINVRKEGNDAVILNTDEEDFKNIWEDYFDLERDYGKIKEKLSHDPLLKESVEFGNGIRILNQEPFELLISFIISANNQIPRIKKCVNRIAELWGKEIVYNGRTYHSFPDAETLGKVPFEDLNSISLGFRAKYIYDTVKKVNEAENIVRRASLGEEISEEEKEKVCYHLPDIVELPEDSCHKALQKYQGVGPKVADCIMLFSMKKHGAFPVDVWVKKAMKYFYNAPETTLPKIRAFGQGVFGDHAGFAQQYLFYNARENKIKVEVNDIEQKI